MKWLFPLFLTCFLTSTVLSQNPKTKEGAFLSLKIDTLNFGELTKEDNATKEISVTNTGDQPLIITDCKGSCGCTVPICPTKMIPPGKSEFISISYDNKNNSGPFKKTVTIKSNAINKVVYLKVFGNVVE